MSKRNREKKRGRILSTVLLGTLTANLFLLPSDTAFASVDGNRSGTVSQVAIDNPQYSRTAVLEVNGKPFWYNGIQIRIDKLKDDPNYACSDKELEELFQIAADDGFTVANSQIRWTDVQPNHQTAAVESAFVYGGENADKVYNDNPSGIQLQYSDDESRQALGYVKFTIADMTQEEIDGAKIRVYNRDAMKNGRRIEVYALEDDSWSRDTITWNNAPGRVNGYNLGGEGVIKAARTEDWDTIDEKNYYDFNVSEFIKTSEWAKDGTVSFAFKISDDVKDEMIKLGDFDDNNTDGLDARPQLVYSDAQEYDFTVLDNAIRFADNAGMKFEVLWFGTDTCSISSDERVPVHVQMNYQKTLDDDQAGTPLLKKTEAGNTTGLYNYIMCKNDEGLRELEAAAVKAVFDHIGSLSNADTVIGCQVSNEPGVGRLHGSKKTEHCMCDTCVTKQEKLGVSDKEFREITMWEYNNNLAEAVKTSAHPVWTRVNLDESADVEGVAYNEKMRGEGKTSIDFIGIDHYRKTPSQLATEGTAGSQFAQGKNLTMMMELGQKDAREDGLYLAEDVLAALSGGSYVTIYDAASADGCEIYSYDKEKKQFSPFRGADETGEEAVVTALGRTNNMLKKIGFDLATKTPGEAGGSQLVYFNAVSSGADNFTQNEVLGNKGITFKTQDNGVGIAVNKNEDEIAFLAAKEKNTFVFNNAESEDVLCAEIGYYDEDDIWHKEEDFSDQLREEEGKVTFSVPAYGCVRIVTKENSLSEPEVIEKAEVKIEAEHAYELSEGLKADVYNDGASAGGWVKVSANKIGDSITITGDVPMDGIYRIDTCYKKSSDRATVQLAVDGKPLGTPLDMNKGNGTFPIVSSGETALTKGTHEFTYTVTGKTGKLYILPLDYVYLTRTGNYVDVSELKKIYDEYSQIEQGNYTDDSWKKFQTALKNAESLLGEEEPSSSSVKTQIQLLKNAFDALLIKTDKEKAELYEELENLVKEAEEEQAKIESYTEDNRNILNAAIEEARKALVDKGDPAVSAEYVATAVWKMRTALDEFKKTAVKVPDGVLLIDENFDKISGNFGFDKGASITDGRLRITEGMENEDTSIKKFDYTVQGQSSVDIVFDWSSDIPEDRGKTGLDFRDTYGRLIFALCGCENETDKTYELRYSTNGAASDSSRTAPEPSWNKLELIPNQIYRIQISADFNQKKTDIIIWDSEGKILVSEETGTTASNLAKMVSMSYWTIAKNGTVYPAVQSIDNFKVYGAQGAGEYPLAGKRIIAFGDSIIDGHLYKAAGFVEFTAEKEGMVIERNYANNGARIMPGSVVDENGLGGTILDCQVLEAADDGCDPDYIIFDGGTNDAYPEIMDKLGTVSSTGTDTFAGAFRSTISAMQENWPDARIIYTAVHKLGSRDKDVQTALHELETAICEDMGVTVANAYDECALDTSIDEMRLKYSFDALDSGNIPIPGEGEKATGTHPNFLAIEEFYVPLLSSTLRETVNTPEPVSRKTLEYFLNRAKEHKADGDADGCVESVRALLDEAIAEGETVMADGSATKEEVMNAAFKLMKAIQALDMKAGDKTDLEMAVGLGCMIDLSGYVEAGQKEFVNALAAAEEVLRDGDAMQSEVDEAWNILVDAMEGLRLKADKAVLEELLKEVSELDPGRYTEQSAAVFRTALASAQAVAADDTLSSDEQQTVDDAVEALRRAEEGLIVKGGETGDPSDPAKPPKPTESSNSAEPSKSAGTSNSEDLSSKNVSQGGMQADDVPDTEAVQTGDSADIIFYLVLLFGAGTVFTAVYKNRMVK